MSSFAAFNYAFKTRPFLLTFEFLYHFDHFILKLCLSPFFNLFIMIKIIWILNDILTSFLCWIEIMKLFPDIFSCWTLTNFCFHGIWKDIQNYIHGLWIAPFSFVGICVPRKNWFPYFMCLQMYFHPRFPHPIIICIKIRVWYTILAFFRFCCTCTFLWNPWNSLLWLSCLYDLKTSFQRLSC